MRDFSFNPHTPPIVSHANSSSPLKFILLVVILFVSILFILSKRIISNGSTLNQPESSSIISPKKEIKNPQKRTIRELENEIDKEMAPLKGSYSIYTVDINSGKDFGINETTLMTAASVNKIVILAALYHLAGTGKIDLEQIVSLQEKDRQDYGSGSIRYDPAGTVYSLKTLARLMMEKSDNTAAYLLATHLIGTDTIQKLVNEWGLTQTDIEDNKSSVKDMSILMIKMYKGEITSKALTTEMMGFMDKSDFDDRIPSLLPENLKIYHKTGDEIGKIHDVGIVDLKDKPYYIGVFTIDMTDDETTKQAIARVSKLIYDTMK